MCALWFDKQKLPYRIALSTEYTEYAADTREVGNRQPCVGRPIWQRVAVCATALHWAPACVCVRMKFNSSRRSNSFANEAAAATNEKYVSVLCLLNVNRRTEQTEQNARREQKKQKQKFWVNILFYFALRNKKKKSKTNPKTTLLTSVAHSFSKGLFLC